MTTDTPPTKPKTPAKPKTKTKAQLAEEAREAARRAEVNAKARHDFRFFLRTVNQGEWLAVCRLLDMSRDTIADDDNLVLLAGAYIIEKRTHGAASLDVLLEMTDEELLTFHGFEQTPAEEEPPTDAG